MDNKQTIQSNTFLIEHEYSKQIQEFQEFLHSKDSKGVKLPKEFLLRCLFSRDFNFEECLKLVENALRLPNDYAIMLDSEGVNMDALGESLSFVRGVKTLQGHHVVFHEISRWNPYKVNYYDTNYCLTLLQGAVGWNDLSVARDGVVVVTDATVVNFHHIKNVTLNVRSTGIAATAITHYMPYNNRYNLVINASYGADLLWKGASLVMPKQMVDTMFFVRRGDDKTLSKYFSNEVIDRQLYRPTQEDYEFTKLVASKYSKYRTSLYHELSQEI
jgi:hypothetical protein